MFNRVTDPKDFMYIKFRDFSLTNFRNSMMQWTLAQLLFDSFSVYGIPVGQIDHSYQARDRRGGISTPKKPPKATIIIQWICHLVMKKATDWCRNAFSFGQVNMIKFPNLKHCPQILFPNLKTWNSFSRVAGNLVILITSSWTSSIMDEKDSLRFFPFYVSDFTSWTR